MMGGIRRILLAEDNANDIELTMAALDQHHLANEVDVVRDGAAAWDYLVRQGTYATRPSGTPVVVLLDLKMPKVDGVEVLRRMRTDERFRTVPVVMLTSSREQRDLQECYQLGANAYVVKPVDFSEFMNAVNNLGLFWAVLNQPPPAAEAKAA